ncbi:MAG TPA: potassium transporter KefA, partial [Lachnospiraceae bacterium]|nr:potassium transporter KefA [Lachnospiraceae bacterium]
MNYGMICFIVGWVMKIEAALLTLPLLAALYYQEEAGKAFLITIFLCFFLGQVLTLKKPKEKTMYTKEGYVAVALGWIVMSILGAVPFLLTGAITNPVDALFETVSGFTTTGASILTD